MKRSGRNWRERIEEEWEGSGWDRNKKELNGRDRNEEERTELEGED